MKTCQNCGTGNDDTRVFCKDCGTRLPAAEGAENPGNPMVAAPAAVDEEAPGQTAPPVSLLPEREEKSAKPKSRQPRRVVESDYYFAQFILILALSALLACLIQMSRQPAEVLEPVPPDREAADRTFSTIEKSVDESKGTPLIINASAINQLLATEIGKEATEEARKGKIERAFVILDFGDFDLFIDKKFFGHSFYTRLHIEPEPKGGGGVTANITGASVGHFPFHRSLLWIIKPFYESGLKALQPYAEIVEKASSVTINPEDVTLKWGTPAAH